MGKHELRRAGQGIALVMLFGVLAPATAAEPMRIMTFNVRYGTADDGANRWELRRDMLLGVIKEFDPDLLGVQEALRDQVDVLAEALPGHACVGVGREADGGGEYSALFYRRQRFDLAAADTFWLSETPATPGSHTWGNQLPRICTWARLLDRTDARRFTMINTHWDHQSQPARERSGAAMAAFVSEQAALGGPVVATGDFNAAEDNPAIAALTGPGAALRDTFRVVHADEANAGTFHGFSGRSGRGKIDYILVTADWEVRKAEIVRTHEGERYPSDHFPVTAVVELPAVP